MSGGDRFRAAAIGYLVYGAVYWVGGVYLLSQGVGVAGGRAGGGTGASMVTWGLVGLLPLVAIPLCLWWPWSWLGGIISRRSFAGLVAVLLALRAWKVAEVALRDGATVAAPWGGEVSFRLGGSVFFAVTVAALLLVVRAVAARRDSPRAPGGDATS